MSVSTGKSPFELNYGEVPHMPIDTLIVDSNVASVEQILNIMKSDIEQAELMLN